MKSKLIEPNHAIQITAAVAIFIVMLQIPTDDVVFRMLSLLNAELTVLFLFSYPSRAYSLHKITNLFILFFFVIANAIQYSSNTIVSSIPIRLEPHEYVGFQFLVFIIVILYNLAYSYYDKGKMTYIASRKKYSTNRALIISMLSLVIMLILYRNNLIHFFIRGVIEDLETSSSDGGESEGYVSYLIIDKVVRAIPFSCTLIAYNYGFSRKVRFLLLGIMLVALFPPGLSRNAIGMYWLPVLLLSIKKLSKGHTFVFMMLLGLLVVFPFFEIFRRWDGTFDFKYSLSFLNSMSFDASQEFMIVMKKDTVTWGYQLLGSVFFFVPRALWTSKPIGSGAFMADKEGVFTNISMPFWGEGYINFGFIGVFIFTLLLANYCAKLDRYYWGSFFMEERFKPYYLVLLGAQLFILRGDLMSSLAYTTGTLASIYISERICVEKKRV